MITDYYISSGYTIKRPSVTNSGGVATTTLSDVATISGLMRDLSGSEIVENEKKGYTTSNRFYCDADATNKTIVETDLIYEVSSGKYFEVVHPKNPMQMDHHLEIDCQFKRDKQNSYE